MQATIQNLKVKLNNISSLKFRACSRLQERRTEAQYHRVSSLISEMTAQLYHDAKFATLLDVAPSRHSTINQASVQHKRSVVTMPDDLPLTDAEKFVLGKGLTFVPVNSKTDEYQVNDHEDASIKPDNDPITKFDTKTSTWTPPDGQFQPLTITSTVANVV